MPMKPYRVTRSDGTHLVVDADDVCEAARMAVQHWVNAAPPHTTVSTSQTVQVQILDPATVKVRLRHETRLIADECAMVETDEDGRKTYRKGRTVDLPPPGYMDPEDPGIIPEKDMPRW